MKGEKTMTKREKINQALELIKAIHDKMLSLKHGYIAAEEFKELIKVVKRI